MSLLLTWHPWKVRLDRTPAVHPDLWNLCMDTEDARSGRYAGGRRPLRQHSVRRGNGQECQCNHSFHILRCSIVWMAMPLIINKNTCKLNIINRGLLLRVFPLFWRDTQSRRECEVFLFHDNRSVTLMGGFGLCINLLWSADSVLWRVVSPGALAAWQVTEARLNVLDSSITLPGVLQNA